MITKKKIGIFYCVTLNHYLNFKSLKKSLEFDSFFIFENEINCEEDPSRIINRNSLSNFINNNHDKITMCIFSTCQLRKFPINLQLKIISYGIKTIAIQETNQMFLHNLRMNNYLLPMDYYLLNSKYEKEKFIKKNYNNNNLVVTGYPFYSIKNTNNFNKNNVIIIFNASNKSNTLSLETDYIQKKILQNLSYYKNKQYNISVKFHPSDNKNYIKNTIKKYSNIKYFPVNNNNKNFLENYNFVLITGYSQLLLESVINNKKIFIIKTKHNENLINQYDLNYLNIEDLNTDFNFKDRYIKKNYYKLYSNHLHIDDQTAKDNTTNFINKINTKDNNYNKISLTELLLWNKNFNYIKNTTNLEKKILNNTPLIFLFNNNLKSIKREKITMFLSQYKNQKIYDSLLIFLIKYLVFFNKNPNKDEFKHILKLDKVYLINYFYWDFQNFINLLYAQKNLSNYERFTLNFNLICLNYNPVSDLGKILLIKTRYNILLKKSLLFRKLYYYIFKFLLNKKND